MELPLPVTPKKDELSDEHRRRGTVLAPPGRATRREGCRPLLGPKGVPRPAFGLEDCPGPRPVAGEEGFEPSNGGSKGRCLTTWRLPNRALAGDRQQASRRLVAFPRRPS